MPYLRILRESFCRSMPNIRAAALWLFEVRRRASRIRLDSDSAKVGKRPRRKDARQRRSGAHSPQPCAGGDGSSKIPIRPAIAGPPSVPRAAQDLLRGDLLAVAENGHAFQDVLQLPHVARPVVGHQHFYGTRRKPPGRGPVLGGPMTEEDVAQQRNVLDAAA